MPQIYSPQVKHPSIGQDLSNIGTLIGAYVTGSPQGAMAGSSAGNMIGNFFESDKGPRNTPMVPVRSAEANAMSRRGEQLSQDNLTTLASAESYLPQLPEDLRQQYAPAIIQARMLEEQRRSQGVA